MRGSVKGRCEPKEVETQRGPYAPLGAKKTGDR